MLRMRRYEQNIDKVKLMLNDVFKLSRVIGTFPIDSEYSGISKYNLAGGVIFYVLGSIILTVSAHCVLRDDEILHSRILYIFEITPIIIFHSINLLWLVVNRRLMKQIYDELMEIESQLCNRGIDWSYNPSWRIKYLGLITMALCYILWEYYKSVRGVTAALPFDIEVDKDN
ncbi:unnamed protein product [Nezara viridula]|uniref:Uncharacterized protein n=1 Tax=Nezara viridula TaxID=85310 RepID=A0A9P0MVL6_NEZVI|nr:unnamed protein product [Nezara viridula]